MVAVIRSAQTQSAPTGAHVKMGINLRQTTLPNVKTSTNVSSTMEAVLRNAEMKRALLSVHAVTDTHHWGLTLITVLMSTSA
jgi:hypothetical protein